MKKSKTNVSVVSNVGIRRNVNVHVGDNGSFPSGDILDANATKLLVDNVADSVRAITDMAPEDFDTLKEAADAITSLLSSIPTKVSDLENDVPYVTENEMKFEMEDLDISTNPATITNQDKISQICDLIDAGTCVMYNSQGGPVPASGFLFLVSSSDGVNLTNVGLFGAGFTVDPSGGGLLGYIMATTMVMAYADVTSRYVTSNTGS